MPSRVFFVEIHLVTTGMRRRRSLKKRSETSCVASRWCHVLLDSCQRTLSFGRIAALRKMHTLRWKCRFFRQLVTYAWKLSLSDKSYSFFFSEWGSWSRTKYVEFCFTLSLISVDPLWCYFVYKKISCGLRCSSLTQCRDGMHLENICLCVIRLGSTIAFRRRGGTNLKYGRTNEWYVHGREFNPRRKKNYLSWRRFLYITRTVAVGITN